MSREAASSSSSAAVPAAAPPAPPAAAPTRNSRSLRWCFTIQVGAEAAHNLDYLPPFDEAAMAYMIVGREHAPTTGQPHLQGAYPFNLFTEKLLIGYVRFKTRKYMAGVQTFLGGHAAVFLANGNEQQNHDYCSKGGNFVEYGTYDPAAGTQGRRTDLQATVLRVQAGASMRELATDPSHAVNLVKHQAGLQALMNLVRVPPTSRDIHTTVMWGPTGTGKSHRVWHSFPRQEIYMTKLSNPHPWDGYIGQPVLFLDEFCTDQVKLQELNTLLDKWPVMLQSRYADKPAFWTTVVIAANSNPMEWYRGYGHNPLEVDSLLRRLTAPMGQIVYVETREQAVNLQWASPTTPPPPPPPPSSTPLRTTTTSPTSLSPRPRAPNPPPLKRSAALPHLRDFFNPPAAPTASGPGSSSGATSSGNARSASERVIIDLTNDPADDEDAQMLGNLDEPESQSQ